MFSVVMPCGAPEMVRKRRLAVLRRTCDRARDLLHEADEVICLANFGDRETEEWLHGQGWKPRVIFSETRIQNPESMRLLMMAALERGAERVLLMEDDWYMMPDSTDWIGESHNVLDTNPTVGQVRLRRVDDYREEFNWVTGAPLELEERDGYRVGNFHATYNPALWRREAIETSFPLEDFWRDEQRTMYWFERAGWFGAQLIPGVFIHRDDGSSIEGLWR